eukprot:4585933-Pyramimonas_sp.AAC.1
MQTSQSTSQSNIKKGGDPVTPSATSYGETEVAPWLPLFTFVYFCVYFRLLEARPKASPRVDCRPANG